MGKLTTHVLDTANGCPAAGMAVRLYRFDSEGPKWLRSLHLNADGRADGPLLDGPTFTAGRYRLVFEVAAYFRAARGDRSCRSRPSWTRCRWTSALPTRRAALSRAAAGVRRGRTRLTVEVETLQEALSLG